MINVISETLSLLILSFVLFILFKMKFGNSMLQMLKGGKVKAPPAWPKTGLGTVKETTSHKSPQTPGTDSDGSDNEDRVPVPQYQNSFGDAIEAAFVTLAKSKGEGLVNLFQRFGKNN